jgi:hypothetical protein
MPPGHDPRAAHIQNRAKPERPSTTGKAIIGSRKIMPASRMGASFSARFAIARNSATQVAAETNAPSHHERRQKFSTGSTSEKTIVATRPVSGDISRQISMSGTATSAIAKRQPNCLQRRRVFETSEERERIHHASARRTEGLGDRVGELPSRRRLIASRARAMSSRRKRRTRRSSTGSFAPVWLG